MILEFEIKNMLIHRATLDDLEPLAHLFDLYRIFYKQKSDLAAAETFIHERLSLNESVIFVVKIDGEYAGFTQLYPSFTSVGMKRIWLLNDLYVHQNFRKKGVGEALIRHTFDYARRTGRTKVILETGSDNFQAQALYEKIGFERSSSLIYEYAIISK